MSTKYSAACLKSFSGNRIKQLTSEQEALGETSNRENLANLSLRTRHLPAEQIRKELQYQMAPNVS